MEQAIKEVISYSQDIPLPQVDDLLAKWAVAKQNFIDAMDGDLIYEYPKEVTFSLTPAQKEENLNAIIEYGYLTNPAAGEFLEHYYQDFYENKTSSDYVTPDGVTIPMGTKITKALKYFSSSYIDLPEIQHLQSRISRVIQKQKVTGKLCLSVHPLDYLSMSENTYNWRTCHSLQGEYAAGNLSYLLDSSTVVCYLKSTKETNQLPNFPSSVSWNNKKWRVLLFFSKEWKMILTGRQYPFESSTGMELIRTKLLNYNFGTYTPWSDFSYSSKLVSNSTIFRSENMAPWYPIPGYGAIPLNAIVNEGGLNYNDPLHSRLYKPLYCFDVNAIDLEGNYIPSTVAPDTFTIGAPVTCLRCGQRYITNSEYMVCDKCIKELYE
jgi:hypothetical protein